MRFIRLTSAGDPMFAPAMELYKISFPLHEQREPGSQAAALGCEDYHFTLIYDGDAFAGELLYWETDGFIYVEHFCMEPALKHTSQGGISI